MVLQTIAAATAGTYTISVSGLADSTGSATLQVLLNTALEDESHLGAANNTRATAQNLNDAFLHLGDTAQRAAVLGVTDFSPGTLLQEVEPNNTLAMANEGSQNFTPLVSNIYQMGLAGTIANAADADFFKLGTLSSGDVLTISLSGSASARGSLTDPYLELYRGSAASPILVTADDDSGPGVDALLFHFTISASDTYYLKARPFSTSPGSYQLGLELESPALAPLTGGTVTTESESNNTAATATDVSSSWRRVQYVSRTQGTITSGDTDLTQFHFTAGDRVTINVASLSTLDARVSLFNSAGTLLASENGNSSGPGGDSPFVWPRDSHHRHVLPTSAGRHWHGSL